jgi:DNA repair protein RadC
VPASDRRCTGPRDVADLVRSFIGDPTREHVVALYLDRQNAFVAVHLVAMGTVDEALLSAPEVFKAGLLCNASSVILAHTHPSGEPTPSSLDEHVTHRIALVGELLGMPLVDHVVLGQPGYYSFAEMGRLPRPAMGVDPPGAERPSRKKALRSRQKGAASSEGTDTTRSSRTGKESETKAAGAPA